MKPIQFILSLMMSCILTSVNAQNQTGQDSTGLPGDNFSLQGALHLFQMSTSPEDFEKQLNTESNNVNNLDLNGDNDIDYIRVIDKSDKNSHVLILQVPISSSENQDIAVIEIEKTGDTTAILQIIGDEDIYGEEVIVEPASEGDAMGGNKGGASFEKDDAASAVIVVNVWRWPSVRYVYAPAYRPWVSPWHWRAYPTWWRPWRPLGWHAWHPFYAKYHRSYAIVHTNRVIHAHKIYTPVRSHSVMVRNRHSAAVGRYHISHTTTHVKGPRGHTATVKHTAVKGPKGHVKARKTTVRRH
ncbi:MAG TPA: hypothetical protein VFG10_00155 [Saprospiraceae bacterium]|nr:hypothetical protein [Saprospiraceae bacterium]